MIKKILLIGIFTGLAHLLSFYGLSYVVKMNADKLFVSQIAEVESTIFLMLSIMSFGLQQVATRDIAIKNDWQNILALTQKNRFSMGLFLLVLGVLMYIITKESYYIIFCLAPILALNVDYALYGRGLSVEASFLSLIKVGVPAVVLIILGYLGLFKFNLYFISIIVSWVIISIISNKILISDLLVKPSINFFKAYFNKIKIGFTDIAITVLKLGILSIAQPFYDETIIANSFVVLKLYVLVKGIQRVIFQAFYKDLVDKDKAFMIDKMGLIIAFMFFSATILYPSDLIGFLFSEDYLSSKPLFVMIGIAALISSISISASPKMLLVSKDKEYINSYFFALIGALLVLVITSQSKFFFYGIISAVLFGEFILNILFLIYLRKELFTKKRMLFFIELVGLFISFVICYSFMNPETAILVSVLIAVTYGVYFIIHNKEFL